MDDEDPDEEDGGLYIEVPSDLVDLPEDPADGIVIHRGPSGQKHIQSQDCWCVPLILTLEQCKAHTLESLDALIDQHMRVH